LSETRRRGHASRITLALATMDEQTVTKLVSESERLNEDESSQWSSVEALWQPYVTDNDLEAQFRLAYYYLFCSFDERPQKRTEMEGLLQKAVERGHPDATYWLGTLLSEGAERDALLLTAGESGSMEAQRALGTLYATGDWTGPRDSARAAEWYRRAAERGHPDAQYNLGFMYLLGEGVQVDPGEGLLWLRRSAEQGDEQSLRLLADLYRKGNYGVAANETEAQLWDERYRKTDLYRLREQRWGAEGA
jgi:uncharacterized protein